VKTLAARQLRRTFGQGDTSVVALDGVCLDLRPGEFSLLMGPSGSGKSTLLAVLSGLVPPDSGEVIALAQAVWGMTDLEREEFRRQSTGFIFQGYNLFPALTARQQLEIVLRWGGGVSAKEARKRSDEMLSLLGLAKKASQKPAQLSGGEKQRVAIGRALIKNPRFCFADEPTSALDWSSGERVIELLRAAAHERESTILIVSHDHRIVPYVDVNFHLEDGRLTETDEDTDPHGTRPSALAWRNH
jgi:putative ABC transport system ATP-binding protein